MHLYGNIYKQKADSSHQVQVIVLAND